MARILVVGLNPAWQKILEFDSVTVGRVNRARRITELASGKGLNTSLVLRHFGHEVCLLQVLGGRNGQKIAGYCRQKGIHTLAYETRQETRTCSTLIDHATATVTEMIEPFSISTDGSVEDQIAELVGGQHGSYDAVLYCGTVPAGLSPGIYWAVHQRVTARLAILDAVRAIPEELLNSVDYVKINRREFEEFQSRFPDLLAGDSSHRVFLLTDGAELARLLHRVQGRIEERHFHLPHLDHVLNPIGAGDTVTAGLAHYLLSGFPADEAFRRALALGSASCLQLEPAAYKDEDSENILRGIRIA